MNGEYRSQTEYKEIDLIDYIKVIIKSKKLILILLLIGVTTGGIFNILLPKIYKAETCLEIGNDEKIIINPLQLTEEINFGIYGDYKGMEVSSLEGTALIKIKITSKNPTEAKNNLENINKLILDEHNQKLKTRREVLEKVIEELEEIMNFLISKNQAVGILQLEIYNIRNQLLDFQPTQAIKEPTVILQKKLGLIPSLIFGGILGIFVGICLAFGKEWWKKNKNRL